MIEISLDSINKFIDSFEVKPFTFVADYLNSLCRLNDLNTRNQKNEKVIYLITGGIAAGKSTLSYNLIKWFKLNNYPFVGTDIFYNLYFAGSDEFEIGYNKAREHTDKILYDYASNGVSFIWETVISKQKKIDYLKYCYSLGYKIVCFFVGTSNYNVAIDRTKIRQAEGNHFVPEQFLIDRYSKTIDSLWSIKPLTFKFIVFDNTEKIDLLCFEDNTTTYKNAQSPKWFKR